jgi:type III pantothenate kinase
MNLAIDIGNTAVKWAAFDGDTLVETGYGMPELGKANRVLACASGNAKCDVPTLNSDTPLPIKLDYKTPATLGADRIADACGAWALHRGEASLVIDAGTCITVDFLDASGVYHGGAIMPGLKMSLQALNTFTAKLPLVDIDNVKRAPVLGRSTEDSILAGTLGATMLALAGYVALYREKAPGLHVLLTGGDSQRLVDAGATGWEMVPHLTLTGLNEIMNYDK